MDFPTGLDGLLFWATPCRPQSQHLYDGGLEREREQLSSLLGGQEVYFKLSPPVCLCFSCPYSFTTLVTIKDNASDKRLAVDFIVFFSVVLLLS